VGDGGPLFLGIDAGNTVVKAVLFDAAGNEVAASRREGVSVIPSPGCVERDLDAFWKDVADVIRECVGGAGARGRAIAAVGCAGHGNGLYLVDRGGAPLLAVQSLDSRAARLAAELDENGGGERLQAICLQRPWPSQTPTLLAWLRRNAPDAYARAGKALLCKDYVCYRLTGCLGSDISDLSGAGMVRLPDCTYDDALLAGYGLADARALLPEIARPTDVVGGVTSSAAAATGLLEGTPVVAGLFDVVACALGSGACTEGDASIIAGTWSINQVISRRAVADPSIFMTSCFGADRFMAIESSATSASNLEWYVRELVGPGEAESGGFAACNDRAAGIVPMADDPFFHPYLHGSRLDARMRAGFYGVGHWHGEAHLTRAVFEGVAFEHRRHVDVLRRAGIPFNRAILSGGGARSRLWPQMFADILGIPIALSACAEAGALGAAIAAGVGVGAYADFEDGVQTATRERRRLSPNPAMARHYGDRYQTFLMLVEAMKPLWSRLDAATGSP